MTNRLNQQREKELTPKRMTFAVSRQTPQISGPTVSAILTNSNVVVSKWGSRLMRELFVLKTGASN